MELDRRDGETAVAYYQRLVALSTEVVARLRPAKVAASAEVNHAELARRARRDLRRMGVDVPELEAQSAKEQTR